MEHRVEYTHGSNIKVGSAIVIDNRPCIVKSIETSKPGKHGSSKSTLWARDIFTGKRKQHMFQNHAQVTIPVIETRDYSVVDISEEGYLILMNNSSELDESFKLPSGEIGEQIKKMHKDGISIIVTVISTMGEENILSCRDEVS